MKRLLLVLLSFTSIAFADDVLRTINVIGRGSMVIKPDTVVISTGVDSGDPVIGVALEENNKIMTGITQGLADLGIESDDIETNNYNVYLYRPYNDDDKNKEEYRVSNSITINIKKLELVDTVIDTIITLGANKINGIYFTFENSDIYENNLREKAIKDAREKAEFLASLEGMKVKRVISIAEEGIAIQNPITNYAYSMAESRPKGPISSGVEEIKRSFNVLYEIVPK
ncbi:DUF541 domain-containing protein [Thiospirochaeta perfilievii]|uniref:DUF541 domain-containing protein n=1 Tax=Thiospirochaeta perfilievii TaxID=252967 RepID=A0A5C1Q814_9SPIO|nr:SIMPL domain-containing protein [Thiospirochaeta perfilievii]QEN03611.1 DUF541 domain-containing protein [Thiospirochaeta perfilievii]